MNRFQVAEACKMAKSGKISGVEFSELRDWRSITSTVCVTIAEVAGLFRREAMTPSDRAKFIECGRRLIRVTDFLPAPQTPKYCEKLSRKSR